MRMQMPAGFYTTLFQQLHGLHAAVVPVPEVMQLLEGREAMNDAKVLYVVEGQVQGL